VRKLNILEKLWGRVHIDEDGGCWEWTGAKRDGYGALTIDGRMVRVHRWVYERLHGPIPTGLQTDHLCRNRACINPAHLELVTNKENVLRGEGVTAENHRKTHCQYGHPFDAANTRITSRGRRQCRTCHRNAVTSWRKKWGHHEGKLGRAIREGEKP